MGKRDRQRRRRVGASGPRGLAATTRTYSDPEAGELELRGVLTPASRREYAEARAGSHGREDAWQRATELLFERLAVSWTIAGVRTERQRELLDRYRIASAAERRFVRDSLRAHLHDNFPEMQAP